jgi:hypothetical protein
VRSNSQFHPSLSLNDRFAREHQGSPSIDDPQPRTATISPADRWKHAHERRHPATRQHLVRTVPPGVPSPLAQSHGEPSARPGFWPARRVGPLPVLRRTGHSARDDRIRRGAVAQRAIASATFRSPGIKLRTWPAGPSCRSGQGDSAYAAGFLPPCRAGPAFGDLRASGCDPPARPAARAHARFRQGSAASERSTRARSRRGFRRTAEKPPGPR